MTKIINLGTSAFYELQEATKKAKMAKLFIGKQDGNDFDFEIEKIEIL